MTRAWRPWLYFGPAALVAGGLAVALTAASDHEQHPAVAIALVLFVSWSFVIAGLIGWTRRPQNRTGKLMVGVGFGVLIGVLSQANYALPYTLGAIFGSLFIAAFVHLLLVYPGGELISRNGRMLVGTAYVVAVLAPLLDSMFPARHTCKPNACPDDLVLVSHDRTAHIVTTAIWTTIAVLLFAAVVALLVGRWRRTTPGLRRILRAGLSRRRAQRPAAVDRLHCHAVLGSGRGARVRRADRDVHSGAVHLPRRNPRHDHRARRRPGHDLQRRPRASEPGEVQEGLRNALRDQTAVVAYWYEEGAHYVDVEGNRFDLPEDTRRRVVTRLEYADAPVAAIVHDAALLQEPELLEGVANAARIALERDKLLVDVRARAKRYRALLQAMPDLMFRISRDGTYNAYNAPNPRDLVTDDVVGLTLWDRLPDELADRVLAAGRRALAGEPGVIEYALDFPEGHATTKAASPRAPTTSS